MITDSMLKKAAEDYANAYLSAIDREFADVPEHQFSPEFEQKIEKLKRKLDHPILFRLSRPLYRAAAVILILLMGSGIWLSVDADAREKVFGWFKNTYEHYFVYSFDDDTADTSNSGIKHYELTWIPEGYNEFDTEYSGNMISKSYVNENGMVYCLFYTNNTDAYLFISSENATEEKVTVNGIPADLYISSDPDVSNAIVWETGNTVFCVSGFLDKDDLIKAAESVWEVKK